MEGDLTWVVNTQYSGDVYRFAHLKPIILLTNVTTINSIKGKTKVSRSIEIQNILGNIGK